MRNVVSDGNTSPAITAAENEIIKIGSYLSTRQYHAALAGNISIRISEDCLLCTRHGADKGALTRNDLVICDTDGNKISGNGDPTSEFLMHRTAYCERPDIRGVIHAHPPTATAFAAASVPLDSLMLPEMVVLLGPVALVPYATPGSEELSQRLKLYLRGHDSFLLENHGALTLGDDLSEAALRMELLEHNAQITMLVQRLGRPFALSPAEMESLMEIRKQVNHRKRMLD